jgi:crotonobetainyl-CoA:carnitine CoA-transferase CaiB-like acyl-CoA transferase
MFDPPTGGFGYPRVLNPNRRPYATTDGYLAVLPYDDRAWNTVFDLAGMGERFRRDPRFAEYAARTAHSEELYGLLAEAIATKSTAEWLALLERHDIPAMPVSRLEHVVDDPHLTATGFFEWRSHPTEGRYRTMRHPVRFARTPASVRRDPPRLGEHTAEVLAEAEGHRPQAGA